jgi:hypothetical protein
MKRHRATVWCLGLVLGMAAPAAAQLPMVGGAYGQVVRLTIAAGEDSRDTGCSAVATVRTRALATVTERRVELRPGESTFVDVSIGALVDDPRRRVELLPAVSVFGGACAASVEVYETVSGRTLAHTPGLLLPAQPGLLLPAVREALTPTGLATSQILRLGVIRGFDPQPDPPGCSVVIGFADATGRAVGPSRAVNLPPGGSSFVDLDPNLLLPASGDPLRVRRFVRPRLLLPAAGGDQAGCIPSVQLIDRLTGWTMGAY